MPRGKVKYDPNRHCGAKARSRNCEPCCLPKGFKTTHFGTGRCKYHGGNCTGAKTLIGKQKSGQNARTHGLYATTLTEKDLENYEAAKEFSHMDILDESFYVTHTRLAGLIKREKEFLQQAQTVMLACDVLFESGELTKEFVKILRLNLINMDIAQINNIMVGTIPLADAVVRLDELNCIVRQLNICKNMICDILENTNDNVVKEIILLTIQEMGLEAGLSPTEIKAFLEQEQYEYWRDGKLYFVNDDTSFSFLENLPKK